MEKVNDISWKWWWIAGLGLGIMGMVYFGWKVWNAWYVIEEGWMSIKDNWWIVVIELLLMVVNVWLEALRWREIDKERSGRKGLMELVGVVLESITMSAATPVGLGEHVGKMRRSEDRVGTGIASVMGSIVQTAVIVAMGFVGLLICWNCGGKNIICSGENCGVENVNCGWENVEGIEWWMVMVEVIVMVIIGCGIICIGRRKSDNFRRIAEEWGLGKTLRVAGINVLRYMVFGYQMYLMTMMDISVFYFGVAGLVMVYYMVITIVPSSGLADIGIRGSVATVMFGMWGGVAGVLVWTVNRVLPALIGCGLIICDMKSRDVK